MMERRGIDIVGVILDGNMAIEDLSHIQCYSYHKARWLHVDGEGTVTAQKDATADILWTLLQAFYGYEVLFKPVLE